MTIEHYNIEHRLLHFKQPAGTSRGVYLTRDAWYVHLEGTNALGQPWSGTGECAPLPDLSCDAFPHEEYEQYMHAACRMVQQRGSIPYAELRDYPSILFGLEQALGAHCHPSSPIGSDPIFDDFEKGAKPLFAINGLVWMGTYEEMRERLEEKLRAGYRCIKLKIGAINFEDELNLIKRIRNEFPQEKVELRVDANGGFSKSLSPNPSPIGRGEVDRTGDEKSSIDEQSSDIRQVLDKLQRLAQYDLHSIEQPIRQGHWDEMAQLCAESPLPIALDEELIGQNTTEQKVAMLDTIKPAYIVLKPMLHGGFRGCDEWIRLAEERHIGWWATSALESNVGLAGIAQWVAQYHPTLPQGLGTGLLYTDNTPAQTIIKGDELWMKTPTPAP